MPLEEVVEMAHNGGGAGFYGLPVATAIALTEKPLEGKSTTALRGK